MEHTFFVKGFILPLFAEGKDLEVRVDNRHVRLVAVGDILVFNNVVRRKVKAIRKYSDFTSMLQVENYKRLFPKAKNEECLLSALLGIYSKSQELRGIFVFELTQE